MMSSDGVSQFFLVYHRGRAMHFDGCKTLVDVVARATMLEVSLCQRSEFDACIAQIRARIDQIVAWRDADDANDAEIERKRAARK